MSLHSLGLKLCSRIFGRVALQVPSSGTLFRYPLHRRDAVDIVALRPVFGRAANPKYTMLSMHDHGHAQISNTRLVNHRWLNACFLSTLLGVL